MVEWDSTNAFNKALDLEIAEYPEGAVLRVSGRTSVAYPNGEDLGWWRENGPQMIERWVRWRAQSPWKIWVTPDGYPGIEIEIYTHIGDQLVKAYVDRVFATDGNNGRLIVADIKSGAAPQYGALQLGIYKAGLEALYPGTVIAGGAWWQARKGTMSDTINLDRLTPEYIRHLFQKVRLGRQVGIFLPNVGSFCKSCKMGKYCAINGGSESHLDPDSKLMWEGTNGITGM